MNFFHILLRRLSHRLLSPQLGNTLCIQGVPETYRQTFRKCRAHKNKHLGRIKLRPKSLRFQDTGCLISNFFYLFFKYFKNGLRNRHEIWDTLWRDKYVCSGVDRTFRPIPVRAPIQWHIFYGKNGAPLIFFNLNIFF